jgi:hypothetical protein
LLVKATDKEDAKSLGQDFIDNCVKRDEDGIDWGEVGGRWKNVIRGNAQPYEKVKETVKDWESAHQERKEDVKKYFKEGCKRRGIKTINGLLNGDLFMSSYYLQIIDNINRKCFCTDIIVYGTVNETASTEYAEKTPEEYWAVMIDVHH